MSGVLAAPPKRPVRRPPPKHRRRRSRTGWVALPLVAVLAAAGTGVWRLELRARPAKIALPRPNGSRAAVPAPVVSAAPSASPSPTPSPSPTTEPAAAPGQGPVNTAFPGLTPFRGNAARDHYGEGPLPKDPVVLWRYPASGGMCSTSTDNHGTRTWCGTGWTGQPNVIASKNDKHIEIRFGAYDGHYHFLDGRTGEPVRPDLVTGDLAKGSWNDDWDAAPLVIGDYLLEGGENSWFYVIRLHRRYSHGLVQVDPRIVMAVPGFDDQLLADIGDRDVSIEGSVAFDASTGVVYFSNSGGLVQGWDISDVLEGGTKYRRVFRFWDGDDTDASIVIGPDGDLYVARKMEDNLARPSSLARDHQIGSLMKLDPGRPDDPVVWSVQIGGFEPDGGMLGTPAYHRGVVYDTFTEGGWVAVDAKTGRLLSQTALPGPTWMSPVPIAHQLLVADCSGVLHDFDIHDPKKPKELWRVQLDGCEESTPAVWHGMIWVGARGGAMYAIGDSIA